MNEKRAKLVLTKKQRDAIWGEEGPYSEVNLIIQMRILDDSVSRLFVEVEASINPLTFKTVKKYRDQFKDDEAIQQMLDHADYRGLSHGYVVNAFREQYCDEGVIKKGKKHFERTKKTIIKMHKFVMRCFDIEVN